MVGSLVQHSSIELNLYVLCMSLDLLKHLSLLFRWIISRCLYAHLFPSAFLYQLKPYFFHIIFSYACI